MINLNKIFKHVLYIFSFLIFITICFNSEDVLAVEEVKSNSDYVLTDNNNLNQFHETLNYLEKNDIQVKDAIPEIGWIETEKTNKQEQKQIEDNTPATINSPKKDVSYDTTSSSNDNVTKSFYNQQWNLHKLSSNPNNFIDKRLNKLTIGIIDSGISDEYRYSLGNKVKGVWNFVPRGGFTGSESDEQGDVLDVRDRKGHGTSVTSLISGTSQMMGVAPDAKIEEYRVFSQKGSKSTWILKALIQAVNNGNDIINLSLGKYGIITGGYNGTSINDAPEYQAWVRAVEYAKNRGSIVVVASGNESLNLDNSDDIVSYINKKYPGLNASGEGKALPASVPGVIQVGATGSDGTRSVFSCYSKDTIYAPGGDTKKTGVNNINSYLVPKEWILLHGGNNYWDYNYSIGTSFSAPEISGLMAHLIVNKSIYKQPVQIHNELKNSLIDDNKLKKLTLDSILNHNNNLNRVAS